ncbi:MAG: MFS transporter [Peptococcaceae bacterium]|nr:MFS transporter [Peptococcaceae bacterium]MBO5300929.1 MFS transporter [Peptococcaceae bacterium]
MQHTSEANEDNAMQATHQKRWLIFFAVVMTTFINCMDMSSINVALPSIADELHVTMSGVEWVVTAYTLVIICFILLFGKLGDTMGKDKIFKFGILVFLAGLCICFFAHTYTMLLIGRIVEGIGAAATSANSQGIIVQTFPAHERGKALGISGSSVALGTMVGPSIGGLIVQHFSWNMIFGMSIPLTVICFMLCVKYLPDMSSGRSEKVDSGGVLLFMVMILCVYGGVKLLQNGASYYLYCAMLLVIAVAFGAVFVRWEQRHDNAMIHLDIFKNKLYTVSVFCAFISFLAISGHNFIQPFYLQKVQMLSAAQTGMLMMAYSITMFVVAPFSGQLSDKIGSEILCFIGLCTVSVALFVLSTLGIGSPLWIFLIGSIMMSFGMAMFQSPNTSLIMSTVGPKLTGIAGSINGLARNLGSVFGISLSTVLLYNIMSSQLGFNVTDFVEGQELAFVTGMQWVYRFMAVVSLIGAVLTGLRWKNSRREEK